MSLRNFILNKVLRRAQHSLMQLEPEHRIKRGRRMMESVRSRVPKGVSVRQESIAGVAVEWLVPKALAGRLNYPVCVYFHGGAFVMGGFNSHRDMAARLAESADIGVLLVDYRLAPEHPFPAALDDAAAVYRALLDSGYSHTQLVIGGDSAGGNIALATAQALRDSSTPLPCAMFLFSPWLDLQNKSTSHLSNAATDAMLNTQLLDEAVQRYAPGVERDDVRLSPLLGTVTDLPPCLIIVSETEILQNDSIALRDKLQRNGAPVTLLQWAHTPHAFPVLARWLPEAKDAIANTSKFIRQHLKT